MSNLIPQTYKMSKNEKIGFFIVIVIVGLLVFFQLAFIVFPEEPISTCATCEVSNFFWLATLLLLPLMIVTIIIFSIIYINAKDGMKNDN